MFPETHLLASCLVQLALIIYKYNVTVFLLIVTYVQYTDVSVTLNDK